jgi:DNA-directed RNA polymerase subunit RPC12/RpoP
MTYLKCPNCSFLVLEKIIRQASYDYYCARCGVNKFSKFEEAKNEKIDNSDAFGYNVKQSSNNE